MSYSYDVVVNRTSLTYPSSRTAIYEYDVNNFQSQIGVQRPINQLANN